MHQGFLQLLTRKRYSSDINPCKIGRLRHSKTHIREMLLHKLFHQLHISADIIAQLIDVIVTFRIAGHGRMHPENTCGIQEVALSCLIQKFIPYRCIRNHCIGADQAGNIQGLTARADQKQSVIFPNILQNRRMSSPQLHIHMNFIRYDGRSMRLTDRYHCLQLRWTPQTSGWIVRRT